MRVFIFRSLPVQPPGAGAPVLRSPPAGGPCAGLCRVPARCAMSRPRLRSRLHDAFILYLAPWLPSFLPWRLAWRCYRWLARWPGMYPEPTAAALRVVPDFLPVTDPAALARDVRSVWLLDAADLYLSQRRPRGWLPDHVEVEGRWPQGAFIAAGFHYSAALWVFHHLHRSGHDATMVLARLDPAEFKAHPMRYRYARRRAAEIARAAGRPIAWRPGVGVRLREELASGSAVLALLDVPPAVAPRGQFPVELLGQPASLPEGTLALAREAGVPVVPYWMEIDLEHGRRRLVIGPPLDPEPAAPVLAGLAARLDALIREQPAAWLFWNEWPGWLRDAAPLHAPSFSNGGPEGSLPEASPREGEQA